MRSHISQYEPPPLPNEARLPGIALTMQRPTLDPPLLVRERDRDVLYEIAFGAMLSSPRLAGGLLEELRRATVRPDNEVPPQFIGLGSTAVCFESDGARSRYHWKQIVEPAQADPQVGRVSVLSELGVALIGMAAGQSILWRDRRGGLRRFFVLEVDTPEPHPPARVEQEA
jgi:regulator of nucleoside diphosphate kinase